MFEIIVDPLSYATVRKFRIFQLVYELRSLELRQNNLIYLHS